MEEKSTSDASSSKRGRRGRGRGRGRRFAPNVKKDSKPSTATSSSSSKPTRSAPKAKSSRTRGRGGRARGRGRARGGRGRGRGRGGRGRSDASDTAANATGGISFFDASAHDARQSARLAQRSAATKSRRTKGEDGKFALVDAAPMRDDAPSDYEDDVQDLIYDDTYEAHFDPVSLPFADIDALTGVEAVASSPQAPAALHSEDAMVDEDADKSGIKSEGGAVASSSSSSSSPRPPAIVKAEQLSPVGPAARSDPSPLIKAEVPFGKLEVPMSDDPPPAPRRTPVAGRLVDVPGSVGDVVTQLIAASENYSPHDAVNAQDRNLLLVQMPPILPVQKAVRAKLVKPEHKFKPEPNGAPASSSSVEMPAQSKETAQAESPVVDSLSDVEPCRFGKLVVLKSGKVKLLWGQNVFDVDLGAQPAHHQSAVSVDQQLHKVVELGDVQRKLVVSVDVDSLVSRVAAEL